MLQAEHFLTHEQLTHESVIATIQYQDTVRASLAPKDGKVHVMMLNSFSKFPNQTFECENKYTGQIDAIISAMQDDGYEILDVKFNSIQGQGLTGSMEGFHTLVMYR